MSEIGDRVASTLSSRLPTLTRREIAEAIGMTPDALSRAIGGERRFAAIELAKLGDLAGTDVYWLITGELDPQRAVLAARHTYDETTGARSVPSRAEDASILANVELAYRQAIEFLTTPQSQLPSTPDDARQRLGQDFVRPFASRLERELGVDVVRVSGLSTSWSLRISQHCVIALAATGNWFHENWSIAHELGHLARNHHSQADDRHTVDAQEAEANAYAAELLLPADAMREIDWISITPAGLADRIWQLGVSTNALQKRLSSLQVPFGEVVLSWSQEPTQRLLRRHRPSADPFADEITERMDDAAARRFPVTLQDAHVELIEKGLVGKETLAWLLDVPAASLDLDAPDEPVSMSTDDLSAALGF